VIKHRQFTKGQKIFVIMAFFVCGLLFYANAVAFNLISAPIYVGDIIAFSALTVAVTLTIITLTVVIRDKLKGLFLKSQKSNVDSVVKLDQASDSVSSPTVTQTSANKVESEKPSTQTIEAFDETPDTVSSPVIGQITDEVEPNPAAVQTANETDNALVTLLTKSSRKKNLVAISIAIIAGLLLYVNFVSFKLIALPEYTMYIALAGVAALTITTITTALIDKPKGTLPKTPIADVIRAIKESKAATETPDLISSPTIAQTNEEQVESEISTIETTKVPDKTPVPVARSAKVFGKRNLFVIIVVLVVGLLLVANAGAFGLISLPQYSIYAALAGAIAIATIPLTILLGDKIKVLGHRIKSFLAEPDIQEIIKEIKIPDQAPDIAPAPVIAQTSTIKVDPYTEMLRQFRIQKTVRKLEADTEEQEKQLPKKSVIPPTKVMCPACRKEFNLPNYEIDYIVDFGQPKRSNLIKRCPHCQTSIPLKRSGVVEEEDIWKD
jgi:hypothetical protein